MSTTPSRSTRDDGAIEGASQKEGRSDLIWSLITEGSCAAYFKSGGIEGGREGGMDLGLLKSLGMSVFGGTKELFLSHLHKRAPSTAKEQANVP